MCRRSSDGHTVGLPRQKNFVGFFNKPVHTEHPFYGYSEKALLFSRLLRRAWEYGGPILGR